jgi:hypothetical protein
VTSLFMAARNQQWLGILYILSYFYFGWRFAFVYIVFIYI